MDTQSRTQITYLFERLRAVSTGITETAATTFLLLIAVRWYEATPNYKAIIAGATSFGLVLSPFIVHVVEKRGASVSKASSLFFLIACFSYLVGAAVPSLFIFTLSSVAGVLVASMATPLLVQMYQENYPPSRRGRMFSRGVMIRIGIAIIFSELAGRALDGQLQYFPFLMLVYAGASAFSSFCLYKCETKPLHPQKSKNPLRGLRYIKEDSVFRNTLICWMLMGFANLMMLPLRIEYLANPKYGVNLSVGEIAFLVGVLPNIARLIMSPIWGALFDKINFFLLRIILNLGFAIGILSFFTSLSWNGLIAGAIVFGVANAGGDIAWSLWVTKFARAERVADYMGIHSFFTGIRGIVAPFAAFHLVQDYSLTTMGYFSAGLIGLASILLIPEFVQERKRRLEVSIEAPVA